MKLGIGAALLSHYAQPTTTLAMLWRVQRKDGAVFGFTNHDEDIVRGGVTYQAAMGFGPMSMQSQTRLAPDNTDAQCVIDSDLITIADLMAGLWDQAEIQVYVVNWQSPETGADYVHRATFGEVTAAGLSFRTELRGLAAKYASTVGNVVQPACRVAFGSPKCGVDVEALRVTGAVEATSDSGRVLLDSTRTEPGPDGAKVITAISKASPAVVTSAAHGYVVGQTVYIYGVAGMVEINGRAYVISARTTNTFTLRGVDSTGYGTYTSGGSVVVMGDVGYFDGGVLTMTSGAAAGLSMEVKAYAPGVITLQLQFPRTVEAGDTYSLTPGCGKRFLEDCHARWDNAVNFRGEPHVPGNDRVMRVGGA
jgi:hypothetical protein